MRYRIGDQATRSAMNVVVLAFSDFQHQHPELMKDGDSVGYVRVSRALQESDRFTPQQWGVDERK
jgi:hypothetical protein